MRCSRLTEIRHMGLSHLAAFGRSIEHLWSVAMSYPFLQRRGIFPLILIRHLPSFLKLGWRLFWDRRVPFPVKLIPLGALAYVILPTDLLPEMMVPFAGMVDDLFVLIGAFWAFLKLSPKEVLMEHGRDIAQGE